MSTSSLDQLILNEFWLISKPEVAAPTALEALPRANKIFVFFRKASFYSVIFSKVYSCLYTTARIVSGPFCWIASESNSTEKRSSRGTTSAQELNKTKKQKAVVNHFIF